MNCPYCNRTINAMTGLQEAQKFQKHLRTCKKNPNLIRVSPTNKDDIGIVINTKPTLIQAAEIRAESGQ